ncbi:MAG: GTP-binding protein, partial [Nitrososphaerota archaeon]
AGVDYGKVLEEASKNVDVIIWDGGNNDFPFFKPTLMITVADALRPYQEISTYPGEANVRMADVVLINKVNSAKPEDVKIIEENVRQLNSRATIIKASSRLHVSDPDLIKDKRVLVIEDGPTVTHGGMSYSIGYVAAVKYGAREIVDPRRFAVGSLMEVYEQYTHIGPVLPAMGYNPQQIKDLNETIQRIDYDVIVSGTPIDLSRILKLSKPYVKVRYELEEISKPDLEDVLRTAGVLRG